MYADLSLDHLILKDINEKQLLKLEHKLNNKPRKIIGYKTPEEVLESELKNVD